MAHRCGVAAGAVHPLDAPFAAIGGVDVVVSDCSRGNVSATALVEQLAVALRAGTYQKNVGVAHGVGVYPVGRKVVDTGIGLEYTL